MKWVVRVLVRRFSPYTGFIAGIPENGVPEVTRNEGGAKVYPDEKAAKAEAKLINDKYGKKVVDAVDFDEVKSKKKENSK